MLRTASSLEQFLQRGRRHDCPSAIVVGHEQGIFRYRHGDIRDARGSVRNGVRRFQDQARRFAHGVFDAQ